MLTSDYHHGVSIVMYSNSNLLLRLVLFFYKKNCVAVCSLFVLSSERISPEKKNVMFSSGSFCIIHVFTYVFTILPLSHIFLYYKNFPFHINTISTASASASESPSVARQLEHSSSSLLAPFSNFSPDGPVSLSNPLFQTVDSNSSMERLSVQFSVFFLLCYCLLELHLYYTHHHTTTMTEQVDIFISS